MEDNRTLNVLDAADGIAFLVFLGIAAANEHDTNGSTGIKFDGAQVEVTCCHTLEEIHDVTLQTQHHTLCLRVAHTTVVFDDIGLRFASRCVGAVNESKEDEALVVDTVGSKSFDGRTDDAVFDFLHPLLRCKRDRRHATHATGIQTRIVFADTLVVLGLRQNLIVLAVGEHKNATLDATHELLDDHTAAGIAEHTAEHLLEFFLGLVEGGENQHALTGT